jgi:hypothetical protein
MGKITKVDPTRFSVAISRDLRMSLIEHQSPGAVDKNILRT